MKYAHASDKTEFDALQNKQTNPKSGNFVVIVLVFFFFFCSKKQQIYLACRY
jgi:hypothetical protein